MQDRSGAKAREVENRAWYRNVLQTSIKCLEERLQKHQRESDIAGMRKTARQLRKTRAELAAIGG